jgi:signal transduction histidine kinase/PAS domain-containing protein
VAASLRAGLGHALLRNGDRTSPASPGFSLNSHWRFTAAGYIAAAAGQTLAALISIALLALIPGIGFLGGLFLLVVIVIALTFGMGPGLFATLFGAALVDYIFLTPHYDLAARTPADLASVALYLAMGVAISLLASQVARSRQVAERARVEALQTRAEVTGRADQLQSAFDAMTDAVLLYDTDKRLVRHNQALERMFRFDLAPDFATLPQEQRYTLPVVYDVAGHVVTSDCLPHMRALNGETLTGAEALDLQMQAFDGRALAVNVSATPVREAGGRIIGAVAIYRDLTERRLLEGNAQKALAALIEMAQTLVSTSPETPALPPAVISVMRADEGSRAPMVFSQPALPARQAARRLAEQTQRVLACKRVTITAVDPEQELIQPLAVSGMTVEQERHMWATWPNNVHLVDLMGADDIERLRGGGILTGDRGQARADDPRDPYNTRSALVAPGMLRSKLVCLLTVDHASEPHIYSTQERALVSAATQLVALVIERERLARERAQAQAREMSQAAAREQMDRFLTLASHELRTPLTTMKISIQMSARRVAHLVTQNGASHATVNGSQHVLSGIGRLFSQRHAPAEVWVKVSLHDVEALDLSLKRAEEAVQRQERLVSDLLDVSSIHEDKLEQHFARVDLCSLVQDVVAEHRLNERDRTLTLTLPEQPIYVWADSDRIRQALACYLSNALRYSPVERPVAVNLSRSDATNSALVSVRDEGPGIAPNEIERIWERFYRSPSVHHVRGSSVGLGLGLFISREIIQRHGGQVGARNMEGERQGMEFWFTLPLATDEEDPATELSAQDNASADKAGGTDAEPLGA